jgi:hypothetical protein
MFFGIWTVIGGVAGWLKDANGDIWKFATAKDAAAVAHAKRVRTKHRAMVNFSVAALIPLATAKVAGNRVLM